LTSRSIERFDISRMTSMLLGNIKMDLAAGLPFLGVFGRRERDKMVGAAGELFASLSFALSFFLETSSALLH
jgi:hypothetical protein